MNDYHDYSLHSETKMTITPFSNFYDIIHIILSHAFGQSTSISFKNDVKGILIELIVIMVHKCVMSSHNSHSI